MKNFAKIIPFFILVLCTHAQDVSAVSPNFIPAGSPTTTVTVTGDANLHGATVAVNGVNVATSPILVTTGTSSIAQTDNFTGDGSTLTFGLSRNPASNLNVYLNNVLQSTSAYSTSGVNLTFVSAPGMSVAVKATYNYLQPQTVTQASQVTAAVPSSALTGPGVLRISAGGPTYATLQVVGPLAPVDSWSPTSWTTGVAFMLAVNGRQFTNGSQINWDSNILTTTFVSANQLTATVSSGLVTTGPHAIHVSYPHPTNTGSLQPNPNVPSPISTTLSPPAVNFGNQNINTTSASAEVFSVAAGQSTLRISSIAVSPATYYAQTNNCPPTLSPGQTCIVDVSFSPTAATTENATLTVVTNAQNSPQTATITGVGVTPSAPPPSSPGVSLSPSALNFGSVLNGTTSSSLTSTLTNNGTATLTISSLALGGTNAADFTLATGGTACPTSGSVLMAATCTIKLTFTPSTSAGESATVTITDNATGSPHALLLTGTGYTGGSTAGCGTSQPASLMCGMTPANLVVPSGWTLATTQNFESGSLPSGQALNDGASINCSFSHSGNCSAKSVISFQGAADQWFFSEGQITGHEWYLSYYDWGSGGATNEEYALGHAIKHGLVGATGFQEIIPDFVSTTTYNNTCPNVVVFSQGNFSANNYKGTTCYFTSVWTQWEIWTRANTPGNSDGFIRIYKNGVTVFDQENANLNGAADMTGMQVEAGGWYTKNVWTNNGLFPPSGTCSSGPGQGSEAGSWQGSFGSVGSGDCAPAPPVFTRYIDDIILLEK